MTPQITRVRYFDSEYLRAFDYAAEQGYHVDMRRRLNMALHLCGIVEGLQLQGSTEAGISQVSVQPGMAIDPFGREIFLLAPYTFDDVRDIDANPGIGGASGLYEVWIQYARRAGTPPSVGYAACQQTDQGTRWVETFKIVLLSRSTPTGVSQPAVTDPVSEDASPDPDSSNGIFLGLINVSPGSTKGVFNLQDPTNPTNPISQPDLQYIGLRAQRIEPPNYQPPDPTNTSAVAAAQNSLLSMMDAQTVPISLETASNLFVDENLIVGPNFNVNIKPAGTFPSVTGNLKVTNDVFLNGNVYLRIGSTPPVPAGPDWRTLADFVKSLTPDIIVGITPVTPSPSSQANGTFTISGLSSSRLLTIGNVNATAAISGIQFNTATQVTALVTGGNQLQIQITGVSAAIHTPAGGGQSTFDINGTWSIVPTSAATTTSPFASPIASLWVSYVAICYPP